MQEHDPVGHLAGEADLVGHDDHGAALGGQRPHHAQHLAHEFRVERGGRLVEQHHVGLHRERPGDGGALLLAARQVCRVEVPLFRDPDLGQQGLGFRQALRLGPAKNVHRALP